MTQTGVAGAIGRWPSQDDSLLGAIITRVMTLRLNGHTPVLQKEDLMFSGVSARTWALP